MKTRMVKIIAALVLLGAVMGAGAQTILGHLPSMESPHGGTWLQWPHQYTYGATYRNRLDATWVAMVRALVAGEKVHIIAYDATEQARITGLLNTAAVPLTNVNFLLRQTDDCWVRDNGPIFIFDTNTDLKITDWGFNGWGLDTPYAKDNTVPLGVATNLGLPRVDLNTVVIEGGAIEADGHGVMMATRSSIFDTNRNPGLTQARMQSILTTNFGVTKFIWLDGAPGGTADITDMHIDGFAEFAPNRTVVTMSNADLAYWGLPPADIATLNAATDINGVAYNFVRLPLTANNVVTTYGNNLGYKGSYVNFYVGNTVVLVPTYSDPNDATALNLVQTLYPGRTVVGIDVRNLFANGGMIHCVTQQQPEKFTSPRMSLAARPGAKIELAFTGKIGVACRLQSATDLTSGNWSDVSSFTPTQPTSWFNFSTAGFNQRFFRVVAP
jgi:agmatine deiminase